jgi:hypothetical protein
VKVFNEDTGRIFGFLFSPSKGVGQEDHISFSGSGLKNNFRNRIPVILAEGGAEGRHGSAALFPDQYPGAQPAALATRGGNPLPSAPHGRSKIEELKEQGQ